MKPNIHIKTGDVQRNDNSQSSWAHGQARTIGATGPSPTTTRGLFSLPHPYLSNIYFFLSNTFTQLPFYLTNIYFTTIS